jgi:uncharacterized repeat protein (TIGR03803 family)
MKANHSRIVPEEIREQPSTPAIHLGRRLLLAVLAIGPIAGLGLVPVGRATAQTFTVLHTFAAAPVGTNSDGANPYAGLTAAGNRQTRYGTTSQGGSAGYGTVFAINADGTGFTNLHSFTGSDGANPWAGLISSGNRLYGTTYSGGSCSNGTVFAINTDGTGFTVLHSFMEDVYGINNDGEYPNAGLILSGNTLYGTASRGGSSGNGTVFALNTDSTGFITLHSFTAPLPALVAPSAPTNSDGAIPVAGLVLSGDTLFGTAIGGGIWGNGTVFAVSTDGTRFSVLHSFEATQLNLVGGTGLGGGGTGLGGGGCLGDTSCGIGEQCIGGACGCRGFCGGGA